MTRALNASTISALATDSFDFATLIEINLNTTYRYTDWQRNISALSQTFVTSDYVLDLGDSTESVDLRINNIGVSLSSVGTTLSTELLTYNWIQRRIRIWQAVLSNDSVVGAPILINDGRITGFTIDDTRDSSEITLEVSNHWKNFEQVRGRKTNSNTQQRYFSTDLGFEFAASSSREIKWGD